MNELFTYLFDEDVLKNKLREKWIKLYDFNFVDKDIIGGLLTTKKNISDLLTFIYNKATASNLPVDEKEKEATLNAPSIAPSTTLKTKTKGEERKDETLFDIFIYLIVFRLNELPLDDFKSLVIVSYIF